jgi:opacity protein-like surface antigen
MRVWHRWIVRALIAAAASAPFPARAQSEFMVRGFADAGSTTFTAAESFKAVLGSERGPVFGGGAEVVTPQGVFVSIRASRFRSTGQRVFLFNGQRFDLGVPVTVTITPLELSAGYRFALGRLVPYGGGGVGWHRYEETSRFAEAAEDFKESFQGYHALAGIELRFARWIAGGAEAQWATVPDALGQDPNGVSREFGESNLGGITLRARVVVGR